MQFSPPPSLILVNYPGAQASALWGLADLFALIPRLGDGAGPQVVMSDIDNLPKAACTAFVFPPSIAEDRPLPDPRVADWIYSQQAQGALACSVCAGAFWLGQAGILDNRPVTTHWALETAFQAAFPAARLQPEHILIDDHDVITAGGLMAWVDLGLHLAGLWYGAEMVSRLARHLLVDPAGRQQRHYSSFRPPRQHGDIGILATQRHMDLHLADPLTISTLAEVATMSSRTFSRRFQAATGYAPATYLQHLRIEKARGALERSAAPVAQIAWDVGYADVAAFTRAFRSVTGLPPGSYRDRFRVQLDRSR